MCLDGISSCSSEARKTFALNLKPSTDTVLQSPDLCVLKMLNDLYEIFHILRFYSYTIRASKVSGQSLVPQNSENTKQ